jgi:hypothetical protein
MTNTIADPTTRNDITAAVTEADTKQPEGWGAYISELAASPDWTVRIVGPDGTTWSREFFGPEQQTAGFISERVVEALTELSRTSES